MLSASAGTSLVLLREMTFFFSPGAKLLNSSVLAQLLFLVSVSERNVLWEVFNTSETEQEEGLTLSPAAEWLARIRSTKASQTKTVLFVRGRVQEFCRVSLWLTRII